MEKKRKYYSPEYKAEALKLALKIGAQKAAEELGLYDSQIDLDQIAKELNERPRKTFNFISPADRLSEVLR